MKEPSHSQNAGYLAPLIFVHIPYVITGILILSAIAINFANILARYVFSSAIFWTEEVLIYLMISAVFSAAVTIAYRGEHINMDLFSSRFKAPWKQLVNVIMVLLFVVCCLFVVRQSFQVVSLHLRNSTRSVAAGIPMAIPHSVVLVGFVLMAAAILYRVRAYIRGKSD